MLGMESNHMNRNRFTLLHQMTAQGTLGNARLLLGHGAAIDALGTSAVTEQAAGSGRRCGPA